MIFYSGKKVLSFFVLLFLLTSCGPKRVDVLLNGASSLNPDEEGNPLPVVVRVYQLTQKEEIDAIEFKSLWKDDMALLKETLLDRQEVTLLPGSAKMIPIMLKEETNYLMLMALFRKPVGNEWKKIIPVRKPTISSVNIELTQQRLKVIPNRTPTRTHTNDEYQYQ